MKNSSVIQTQSWLIKFYEACLESAGEDPYTLQCEFLCARLVKSFPAISPEELQYELLNHGLFDPIYWTDISKQVQIMVNQRIWEIVDLEYRLLKGIWKGPKVSIYIFPLNKVLSNKKEEIPTKNGVAFKEGLFLFLSVGLETDEIKAMFAHEYNHICRLKYLGLTPDKIPLKDSLIIEGLGEFAVKELYGKKWLAPWTDLYSYEGSIEKWRKYFIPRLDLLGTANHQTFLYGKVGTPLPKWIGYYFGYQIINSFQKKHGPFNNHELYKKSSDELIAGSDFPANRKSTL